MYPLKVHDCGIMNTEELLDMISSIARKRNKMRGDLRIEVLLESMYRHVSDELKQKQMKRKRKWEEYKVEMCKKARISERYQDITSTDSEPEDDPFELDGFFQRLSKCTTTNVSCRGNYMAPLLRLLLRKAS